MVSEDYLGLNAQLVLAVSHNSNCEVLFSNYNEFIQLVTFQSNPIRFFTCAFRASCFFCFFFFFFFFFFLYNTMAFQVVLVYLIIIIIIEASMYICIKLCICHCHMYYHM